jgi:hypothetical protein
LIVCRSLDVHSFIDELQAHHNLHLALVLRLYTHTLECAQGWWARGKEEVGGSEAAISRLVLLLSLGCWQHNTPSSSSCHVEEIMWTFHMVVMC